MAVEAIADEILAQRERLLTRLADQREDNAWLWGWYRGRQQLPDVPSKYQAAYQLFLAHSVTPWARLVVDAICERLRVQGFRDTLDAAAAQRAWEIFVRSRLNADQRLVYTEALIGGKGYLSVSRREGDVYVVPESAFEVTHEPDLSDRAVVAGALKLYPLDYTESLWVCELYRPDATYRWLAQVGPRRRRRRGDFPIDESTVRRRLNWEVVGTPEPNRTGVVPMVPFENRVNVLSGGASEIEDCVPVLQRIDRLTLDMMLASHFGSFRQKWATGLQVPRDPDTGKPVEPYKAAVNRLWVNESTEGRFGTFEASDPAHYLSAIDSQIATLAAISRVPAHYLLQRNLANPPSAESLIASETGLTAKVQDRQATYGEAWETAFTLALNMDGHQVQVQEIEVDWVDAEKRNPAQMADAAIKLQQIGVPQQALWSYVGIASPQQIEEWTTENAAAALLAAATTQPETQPGQQQPTPPGAQPVPPETPLTGAG